MCPLFLALQLVQTENVRGVVTMNEVYETKYFCNSAEVSLPVVSRNDGVCPISTDWRASGAKMLQFVWCVLAGVACCRGGTAETEHCRPDRRPQSGKSAPRCGVCPEVPWAGQQCLRPLQSWTLTQCHTGRCLPNTGQSVIIHISDPQWLQHLLNLIQSMTWKKKMPKKQNKTKKRQPKVKLDLQRVPYCERMVCLFIVFFMVTVALLDSRGSLWEAGVHTAAHPGALGSAGDAEEVPSAGVRPVGLNLHFGTVLDLHFLLHKACSSISKVWQLQFGDFHRCVLRSSYFLLQLKHLINSRSTCYLAGHTQNWAF